MTDSAVLPPPTPDAAWPTFAAQRLNMVDSQVRPSDITDRRIIRAMGMVPRELFVPTELRAVAYMDNAVALTRASTPLSPKRWLIEPRLFAKLVQLADIPDAGRVLEIGSGTGYGVAVLAAMALRAVGLEDNADLAVLATQTLAVLATQTLAAAGIANATVRRGPLAAGLPADGPFDAIILAGSVPEVPSALFDQLKTGARLVAVAGSGRATKATVWIRSGMTFDPRAAFDADAAPLPGFSRPASFVF